MNKKQLIQIAKVGFPDRVKESINFKNCEIHHMSGVWRLYDKDEEFLFVLPRREHLAIYIDDEEKFVQITCENKAFNHYAAIKEMERLGLV